jgi:hypothetical protein
MLGYLNLTAENPYSREKCKINPFGLLDLQLALYDITSELRDACQKLIYSQ